MDFQSSITPKAHAPLATAKFSLAGMVRKRTAAEQAELKRHKAARALPDDLFADRPEVVNAREVAERAQRRAEQLPSLAGRSAWVSQQIASTRDAISSTERELDEAILDDLFREDGDFSRSKAVRERLRQQECHLDLLGRALDMVSHTAPSDFHKLKVLANDASATLSNLLFNLKLRHIDRHPHLADGGEPV